MLKLVVSTRICKPLFGNAGRIVRNLEQRLEAQNRPESVVDFVLRDAGVVPPSRKSLTPAPVHPLSKQVPSIRETYADFDLLLGLAACGLLC